MNRQSNKHKYTLPRFAMEFKPLVIAIEGGIGAGKSTVLQKLKHLLGGKLGIAFVDEPVSEWEERGFLQAMYKKEVNSCVFQHMVLTSLAGDLLKTLFTQNPAVVITERSAFSNLHVFAKANLVDKELEMYEFTWKRVVDSMLPTINTRFIYLDTSIEEAKKRIRTRNRGCESDIEDEYIQKICRLHEEWLAGVAEPEKCVRINANQEADVVAGKVLATLVAWIVERSDVYLASRRQPRQDPAERAALLRQIADHPLFRE